MLWDELLARARGELGVEPPADEPPADEPVVLPTGPIYDLAADSDGVVSAEYNRGQLTVRFAYASYTNSYVYYYWFSGPVNDPMRTKYPVDEHSVVRIEPTGVFVRRDGIETRLI